MKNLFIGGSSQIAKDISSKITNVDSISQRKTKGYKKNFKIKKYNKKNLKNIFTKINHKYDNILIFNGKYDDSSFSNFDSKLFYKSLFINLELPLICANEIIKKNILKENGSIYFISSISAEKNQIGSAYYSLSKNALNFSAKILSNEQKKRNIRINVISLGLINNEMGRLTLSYMNKKNLKIIKKKKYIDGVIKIIKNKKINGKKYLII
ncbi:SDR family NAD(P)-dependent oxidoreductase [Candidatus Pelagibacter sp.]|nr:SDR family NAD(P)-dependent oxidoreductase [Candidatus Pelagibacter sp.]